MMLTWLLLCLLLRLLRSSHEYGDGGIQLHHKYSNESSSNTIDNNSYVVLTRMFHDYAYLTHFITWHLSLGFDFIYIICTEDVFDREPDLHLDPHLRSHVEIFYDESDLNPDLIMDRYVELIRRRNHTWVLSIDLDEFLMLSREYQNVQSFVEGMESHFNGISIDLFQLHWALLEYTAPSCPNMTLVELVNHTVVHHSPLTKSLVRLANIQNIRASHYPTFMKHHTPNIFVGHSVVHELVLKHPPHKDSYKYASLLHVRTRGLTDNFMKAISTRFEEKKSHSRPQELLRFVEEFTDYIRSGGNTSVVLDSYVKQVGLKASTPLSHSKRSAINILHSLFPVSSQHVMFCNQRVEYQSMQKLFSHRFYSNVADEKARYEKALNLTEKFQQVLAPALAAAYQLRSLGYEVVGYS